MYSAFTNNPEAPVIAVLYAKGGMGDSGRHAISHALRAGIAVRGIAIGGDIDMGTECPSVTHPQVPPGSNFADIRTEVNSPSFLPTLETALEGTVAVINAMGNRQPKMPRWTAEGTRVLLQAMHSKGVRRLVHMSSVGLLDDWPPMRWKWWVSALFGGMLLTVIRSAKTDLTQAELAIQESGLDYVIVRPTGLTPNWVPNGFEVQGDDKSQNLGMSVAKEDVGAFLLNQAIHPTIHRRAITLGSNWEAYNNVLKQKKANK